MSLVSAVDTVMTSHEYEELKSCKPKSKIRAWLKQYSSTDRDKIRHVHSQIDTGNLDYGFFNVR